MEKGESKEKAVATYLKNLDLNLKNSKAPVKPTYKIIPSSFLLPITQRPKPPSLLSLCLGVVGRHFEDIIDDLAEIAANFPSDIRLALAAIAKRRKLLNDDVVAALAESSWEILDISGSDVSDVGLVQIVKRCKYLRAVDISRCSEITSAGVSELLQHCHSLEILRWGGCPRSEYTARRSFGMLKPTINYVEGESWEELDAIEIGHGAQSLRWLVWPKVDKDMLESLAVECPRIVVNPKPSPLGFRGTEVPREALQNVVLDEQFVEDINPQAWAVCGLAPKSMHSVVSASDELPMAEKFRLAFIERDTRLAPKRAKNARQQQRRAEREWVTMDARAKAMALASRATKSLHIRNH